MGERDKNPIKSWLNPEIKRRTFLEVSSILALASAGVVGSFIKPGKAQAQPYGENPPDTTDGLCVLRSACQMCHSRCGIQATLKDGVLIKIDGNPYHPNNMSPDERVKYGIDTTIRGHLCLKGQSGIQTVYDPYRIKQPLKRVGSRGSGQWEAISWPQAFSEIATQINTLIPQGTRYSDMDPLNTKKGKNTNLLGFSPGRTVEAEMSERIWKYGWGTANYALGHTSICESSRHVANELITWEYKTSGGKNSMGAGRSSGWQPDILGAEYIIYFGSNPLEAGFPMLGMARNLMEFKKNGKYVVVDPRFSNSAAQAHQWVPIKPGGDSAMAMGMARWIIENNRYDKIYLENTNLTSAGLDNETTYTDSTYLVRLDNKPYAYLKASDIGIGGNENVVWSGGEAKKYDAVPHGELDVEVTVKGIKCKTGFRLFKEEALTRSISQYAAIAGVDTTLITGLANELTNHGKKAVVGHYRGPCKHTNGLYAVLAIQHLNTLIGNYDWKGGCTPGAGGWGHTSGVVTLSSVSGAPGYGGVEIARCKKFYDPSEIGDLFKGYPAPRQWFPFGTHGNYQEVIPSIVQGYPYDMKVMITYWNAWPYATPALRKVFKDALVNNKIELFVAITPVYGEVAEFADYILPDTTYLEKFGVPGIPWRVEKGTSFQRPVVGKFDGREIGTPHVGEIGGNGSAIMSGATNDYTSIGDTKAVLDIHIGLAKALGYDGTVNFPGKGFIKAVGAGALSPTGEDLYNSWDWADAILRNIQFSSGFTVDTILQKGGVFRDPGDEYTGDKLTYKYGNIIRLYLDTLARTKDSVTGEYYSGVPHYEGIMHPNGTPVTDTGYKFQLITYKTVTHGQARTAVNPWLMLVMPENYLWINPSDADPLGIETGDMVRVTSPTSHITSPDGYIKIKAKVTELIRPGVVGISHHYGHWQLSSRPYKVGVNEQDYDPSRGAGAQPNEIMRIGEGMPSGYIATTLQERIGASCSFFDTRVNIQKI